MYAKKRLFRSHIDLRYVCVRGVIVIFFVILYHACGMCNVQCSYVGNTTKTLTAIEKDTAKIFPENFVRPLITRHICRAWMSHTLYPRPLITRRSFTIWICETNIYAKFTLSPFRHLTISNELLLRVKRACPANISGKVFMKYLLKCPGLFSCGSVVVPV